MSRISGRDVLGEGRVGVNCECVSVRALRYASGSFEGWTFSVQLLGQKSDRSWELFRSRLRLFSHNEAHFFRSLPSSHTGLHTILKSTHNKRETSNSVGLIHCNQNITNTAEANANIPISNPNTEKIWIACYGIPTQSNAFPNKNKLSLVSYAQSSMPD
jgi:hypothetical protein